MPDARLSVRRIPEGFCEDLARQTTVTHLSQLQLETRRCRILVLCCRIWVSVTVAASQRSVFRSPHGLLGYQRSSALFRPVCLSPDSQSDCLRFFPPPRPPLVDSLDSELWYYFGCRAAALASAAPRPLGRLFGSFFTTQSALQ